MSTRTPFSATAAAKYNATDHDKMPKGWLGHIEVTTNQTGITTEVDLTNLTLTVTVPANRMLEITAKVPVSSATADDRVGINIKEGSTVLGTDQTTASQVNLPYTLTAIAIVDGASAGSHTYKVSAGLGGGATGPMRTDHASNGKSVLVVKDIGPSSS